MKKLIVFALSLIAAPAYSQMIKVTNADEIKNALKSNGPVILIIHSNSCPHCIRYMPKVEEQSDKREDITFLAVEANQHPDIAQSYMIKGSGVPQTIVFENGKKVDSKSFAGGMPAKLNSTLTSIK